MVHGGRSGRGSTSSDAPSTSVGQGVRLPADYAGCPGDRVRLPDYTGCPGDRVCLSPSGVTFPIPFSSRAIIQRQRRWLSQLDASHAGFLGLVDSWKEFPPFVWDLLFDMFMRRYMFTRPEDLPQARVIWESTTQTNFRKLMWEARDKAAKTTGSQDPTAWMDYGLVWMRRDYWESLYHRWATGSWQERSHADKCNRAAHPEKNVHTSGSVSYATHNKKLHHELERAPTFRELFDRTHKRKGTDDYVSKSARMIAVRDL
ncbi:hypothetical protein Taro_012376 [Colocasia esculenta]|uniref:Uncharacterized protein n=1 Tax=Colocasia esculenta TaxID=4460 RepID=A0A843U8U9_COLES|nr:hypothetical protein [Colocasia esculenta]